MRKFLANVMYLFFGLPLALSALMLLSVRPWALDRDTYTRMVLDDRLYAVLRSPEAADHAPETIETEAGTFDGPALIAAVQKNLPVDAVKRAGEGAIDAMLGAATGTSGPSAAAIDLKPLKSALKAASPSAARDYVAALPAEDRPPSPTDFTFRPASVGPQTEAAILSKVIVASIDAIPDAPPLEVRPKAEGPRRGSLSRGPSDISQALLNRTSAATAAFAALLLAGLGALGGSSWGARLTRAGKYVLIPSVFVLAIGAVLAIPGGLILQNLMPEEAKQMLQGEAAAQLRAYLASSLGPIARSFFVTGLVGTSLGGLLVSSRRIVEPKEIE